MKVSATQAEGGEGDNFKEDTHGVQSKSGTSPTACVLGRISEKVKRMSKKMIKLGEKAGLFVNVEPHGNRVENECRAVR